MIKHYESALEKGYHYPKETLNKGEKKASLELNLNHKFQEILGFGGAFTEAAAYTFSRMSKNNQEKILKAYFDPSVGLRYNLGRVAIHSCDFALENYTYVEEKDTSLESFNIDRDFKWVIPMVKSAEKVRNSSIQLLASPWSPPAWMKTNNDMNHGGSLLPEYRDTWARYYVKFLEAYQAAGLDVFALSVQNEPAAKQVWDSCVYSAEEERDFVKNHLGPTLHKSGYEDVKLVIWDHNRDILVERAETVLSDLDANKYVWGTGIHWYVSEAFENLSKVHNMFPDKHIIFTEGCIEGGPRLGSFETGERYARNMIGDFNHYNEAFIDWNLILDETGGPNHVGNYCDAPILCDTQNDAVHLNSSYYAIMHFSRHVDVGARRIASSLSLEGVNHVAFMNPNGDVSVVVQNTTETDVNIEVNGSLVALSKRSISTIQIRGEQ